MSIWIEGLISFFLLVGSFFALAGAVGLYRLPDFFTRLHAPTKATTLGVGGIGVASMLYFAAGDAGWSAHEVLLVLFLFLTAPVSAHVLAVAALQKRVRPHEKTRGRPWTL